jgi:tryptophan 2,3-dioxygenase
MEVIMVKKLTDYEKYIRTEELLSLQKKDSELCTDDELTFQVIHQISELHFKLIIQAIGLTDKALRSKELSKALDQLSRINIHVKHLPEVFNMVKVIRPIDYHTIRLALGQGSGQDSPGFNEILKLGPSLWEPFSNILEEEKLTLMEIHQSPDLHPALFNLIQELIRFDENFQSFRHHHVQLVKRMIGLETNSLKGVPAKMLHRGVHFEFYPELWKVISELTDWTGSSYQAKPLEDKA